MAKRRLPLLKTDDGGDDPPRSPWQWVGFGAAAIFVAWVPLSILVAALSAALLSDHAAERTARLAAVVTACAFAVELAAGALAGGYLVGRWGPKGVGEREGALSGLVAAAGVALVTWASFGLMPGLLFVGAMAPLVAALGARIGLRRRARGGLPPLD